MPFRQHDVTRALRAARAAGLEVSGYEIEPSGKITIRTGVDAKDKASADLDRWIASHPRATRGAL